MRTIVLSLMAFVFFTMLGCSATQRGKIASTVNKEDTIKNQTPIFKPNCTDCNLLKQVFKEHFLRHNDSSIVYNQKNRIVQKYTIYYSDINMDSLIKTENVQRCFNGCFTFDDVREMMKGDSHYINNHYKYGVGFKFTHRRTHPQVNINGDSGVGVSFDSLNRTKTIMIIEDQPID